MGLIQDHVQELRGKISKIIAIENEKLSHELEKFIGKPIKILPTVDTKPESVPTIIVKGIEPKSNFFDGPLLVVVTDNDARIPVRSQNEIEVEDEKK